MSATTDKELLDAMPKGGSYEVRVVDSERAGLLLFFLAESKTPVVAANMSAEQLRELSDLLVRAAQHLESL